MLIIPERPPMGWNSWNVYLDSPDEEQMKLQMREMAAQLLPHGYEYFVTDAYWYRNGDEWYSDGFGRLYPHPDRYPSAKDGSGFKNLADYAHRLGLKFGMHMMRGINTCVLGKGACVQGTDTPLEELINYESPCPWSSKGWYGVRTDIPEAQKWYDSLINEYAAWGVDFIKYDDICMPLMAEEIEMIDRAINSCGRDIVLSLSPGSHEDSGIRNAEFLSGHASMWRIAADFWDSWDRNACRSFNKLAEWNGRVDFPGWADPDMLPLGWITEKRCDRGFFPRKCRFSEDEMKSIMTLTSISRSPLILTVNLERNDGELLAIQTQPDCLAVNQRGSSPKVMIKDENTHIWTSHADGHDYIAVFNLYDKDRIVETGTKVSGLDVWYKEVYEDADKVFVPGHGVAFIRLFDA